MAKTCRLNAVFESNKQFKEFMESGCSNSDNIRILKRLVIAGIDSMLTERQKSCVKLYYFNNIPQKEIARMLGVNPSTVTRSIQSAVNRLSVFADLL